MDIASIALLLAVAALCGIIAKVLRQPPLIGYVFAGLILTLLGFFKDASTVEVLGHMGVTLLLFLVGLEMNFREFAVVGKIALATGLGQIIFTSIFGFLIARLLGLPVTSSLYIAIGLTFSSTIIIVKLLSEKNDLDSLYGKIAVGFLLVQDVVAMLLLMFLGGLGTAGASPVTFLIVAVKAAALLAAVIFLSKKILPSIFEHLVASSSELLFISSIAWALGVAALVGGPLGFTYEVGGLLAGLALTNIHEHVQIAAKTRPLRDFFLTLFFLFLGTKIIVGGMASIVPLAVIFALFVLIGNPLIMFIVMSVMGHKKRTAFMTSMTVAQVSEFSLVLMAMGATLGHVTQSDVALVVLVGVITMVVSTYLILGSEAIYEKIAPFLSIFERKKKLEINLGENELKDHVILVGGGRTGKSLTKFFKRSGVPHIIIDFNPQVIQSLAQEKIEALFGDISDPEIFEKANVAKSKLLVSTTASFSDNQSILRLIKQLKRRPIVIMEAATQQEALDLYKLGASYIILPTSITGEHLRNLFTIHGFSDAKIKRLGKRHKAKIKI